MDLGREGDGEVEVEVKVEEKDGGFKEEEWTYGRPVAVNRCMASVSCARGAVSVPSSKLSWLLEMEGDLREKMGMVGITKIGFEAEW